MQLSFWEKNTFLKYDFIIVGSGILGLSTACEIKERNPDRSILVLERGILPSGASTKNAGFACFGSLTEILSDFARIGQEETISLVEKRYSGVNMLRSRLGDDSLGYLTYGGYELIDEKHIDSLNEIGKVNKLLAGIFNGDAFEIRNQFIKKFGFSSSKVNTLVYSPFESQIDAGKMMDALMQYTASLGIRIITGCEVTNISEKENHVKVFFQSNSDGKAFFDCSSVIICTNAFTEKLLTGLSIHPGRGHVLITKPVSNLKFKGIFHYDEGFYYFRNFEDRVIFGGGRNLDFDAERTTEFSLNERIKNDLINKLDEMILPGIKYEIDMWWTGIMGFNESRKPEIRKLSDRIIFSLSCNGMGIALSSYVAREIVNEIPAL